MYFGRVDALAGMREQALAAAYVADPERFINGPPRVPRPSSRVLITPTEPGTIAAEQVILARDSDVAPLRTPPQNPSTALIIHFSGVNAHRPGAELT